MKSGLYAVINIGTGAFRLHIGSFVNGKYKVIESLLKSLSLGKDTFSKGFITLQNSFEAVEIISAFKNKIEEYKIKNSYVAVATSSVRESNNRSFFIDFLKKRTGIDIILLDAYQEMFISYLVVKNEIANFEDFERDGVLFAVISSGNVALTAVKGTSIKYSESLPFGSLRLNEIFKNVEEKYRVYAFNEYIENMLFALKDIVKKENIKNIVITGSSANTIRSILDIEGIKVKYNDILNLYENIKFLSKSDILSKFKIRENEADILKSIVSIYKNILSVSNREIFYLSKTSFPHKLLMYYTKNLKIKNLNNYIDTTVMEIGEKYKFDKQHSVFVNKFALKLFKDLQNIHLLPFRMKQILSIAALLHDVGYFINPNNHEENSYYIINSLHLPGFTSKEIKSVALISLLHRGKGKDISPALYDGFTEEEIFNVKKLSAILKIADALDASHKQYIKEIDVVNNGKSILIYAYSDKFIYFEQTSFKVKSKLFEKTFGIKIKMEHKIE